MKLGTDAPLPPIVSRTVRVAFERLSAARAARGFHPRGVAFAGRLHCLGLDAPTGSRFLDEPADYPAVMRFSRGAGIPDPLPDVLGIALRACDADGPGRHRDLLFSSSASPPLLRHLLSPAVRFGRRTCSTILPYRTPAGLVMLAAAMDDGPSVAGIRAGMQPPPVRLLVARPLGGWRQFGLLAAEQRLDGHASAALGFDPWHTGPDLQPAGWLNALRRPAYAGSRAGRPVRTGADDTATAAHRPAAG